MKKQQAEAAAIGRTLAEDTPEKFDARQKVAMQNSIRRTAEQIASMKKSLASSRSETSRADQARAKVSKQIAEGERQFTKDIELAEKRIADARKKLADQIEESTRKGDDPTAFDRYCEDHGFPRQ